RAWASRSCAAWASALAGPSGWRAPRAAAPSPPSASGTPTPESVNAVTPRALALVDPTCPEPMPSHPRNRKSRSGGLRRAAPVVVVLLLAAGALWWWRSERAPAQEGYRTTTIERGDIRVAISATGTLSAISTVTVGSQVSGQVIEVLADFNDKVAKGQVIARIDPSTYEAQIEQGTAQVASAQASLRQAQASLRNAELDFQRKTSLGGQQLVARSDIDLARAARDQAKAQVSAAQAQIRQQAASTRTTRVNLDRTV